MEASVFLDLWNKCKKNVKYALGLHENTDNFTTYFDKEVEHMLMLLKLIPERQKGRKTISSRLLPSELFGKLVVFSEVSWLGHFLLFNIFIYNSF